MSLVQYERSLKFRQQLELYGKWLPKAKPHKKRITQLIFHSVTKEEVDKPNFED